MTSRGGFTGLPSSRAIDVDSLPDAQQKHVRELLDRAFWQEPATQRSPHPQPQDFEVTVTVEDGTRKKTVTLHKSAASAQLRDLLDWFDTAAS